MKTKNVEVYITDDGEEFTDKGKAKHHEMVIREKDTIREITKFISVATTGRELELNGDNHPTDDFLSDFYEALPTGERPFDDVHDPRDMAVLAVNMVMCADGLMLKAVTLAAKLLHGRQEAKK